MNKRSHSHLRLVTEGDRIFYDGPITRLGLWYRYPSIANKKVLLMFVAQCVLLRIIFYFGFHY